MSKIAYINDEGQELSFKEIYEIFLELDDLIIGSRGLCQTIADHGIDDDAGCAKLLLLGLKEMKDLIYRLCPSHTDIKGSAA